VLDMGDMGIPVHFSSCFSLALRAQGVYGLFMGGLDRRNSNVASAHAQTEVSIMPRATTFRFSPIISSGTAAHDTSSVLSRNQRVTYSQTNNQ